MTQNKEFLYQQNEKILCYHGPMIYEAKILDFEYFENKHPKSNLTGPHYLIHYKGWKNTWDEWVAESRVLKFNETNLTKQKQIEESLNKKGRSTIKKTVQETTIEKGKKRRRDTLLDKDESIKKPKIYIPVPEPLRAILVQDWENVNKSSLFVPLPRKPTVSDIIEHYRISRTKKKGGQETDDGIADEIITGVLFYFNKCLGSRLLYQSERKQYREMRYKFERLQNSQIYGAEHLLRLFVSFPQLISGMNLAEDTLGILKEHLTGFLNFLNDNRKEYFVDEYQKIKD
ncbi:15259_t:CDS:2 [Funneliformis geosporum]|uniref:Chromatin modification-related protein EAF3 n=1 Tax=Funneliformis geosporum TaxID=1117311 RepID=A0A9W4SLR4_9GLOM|nr:7275_t:CDS:2 [Funneliformis geosporum]CAI2180192.1 15259_t:CDS:2 [Funneliformis geosporum]